MKCFYCPEVVCRTEYPEGSVVSVCPRCDWRSTGIKIPIKIPPVQSNPLVNTPKSNIFDQIYINNEVRVDSMSQNMCQSWCKSVFAPLAECPYCRQTPCLSWGDEEWQD